MSIQTRTHPYKHGIKLVQNIRSYFWMDSSGYVVVKAELLFIKLVVMSLWQYNFCKNL